MKLSKADDTEVRLEGEGGLLIVRPLADNAIRVRFTGAVTGETPSLILTEKTAPQRFVVSESPRDISVSTTALTAVVDRETGAVSYHDPRGGILLREQPGTRVLRAVSLKDEWSYEVAQTFHSPPDERLYGTGQFQDGYLDVRDLPRRLTQVNSQISIPILFSSRGYGLLWHNYGLTDLNPADRRVELKPAGAAGTAFLVDVTTSEGTKKETRQFARFVGTFFVEATCRHALFLDIGQTMARRHAVSIDGQSVMDIHNYWLPPTAGWLQELSAGEHVVTVEGEAGDAPSVFFRPSRDATVLRSPVAEALDYVVIAGHGDQVIATYRRLTGQAPLMPLWALGYIHCRERFTSQKELLETAAQFRRRRLPMDLIVQDWQYWGSHGWNAMRFDETDYPDPAGMVRGIHAMNARLMLSVWSKIDRGSVLGKECAAGGFYLSGTDWVDFFNPSAAAFYWKCIRDNLLPLSIDSWWLDATEPENDDLAGRTTFLGPGEKTRNIYPLFVSRTVYEGQRRDAPDKRVLILTRSAFPGMQRYAAATWSGDIGNDWETLRRQIPAGLNYMITGLPWWTTDCGGFFRPGPDQYTDPEYHERFLRWIQYATFCPLMRVHGYQTRTEPWRFGKKVERETRRFLELRYRLLPYIYSEASRVTSEGTTLMRPLVMDFWSDPAALDQRYQYMFGPAFLVAPVLQPGAREWVVYLPRAGAGWHDFWTGERLPGGQAVTSPAPLERIPLYVRSGSIVPLGPPMHFTGEKKADPIELRVYIGADASFTLYEDDGVTNEYEKGTCASIPLTWDDAKQTLVIGMRRGEFPGMPKERTFHVVRVRKGHGVGIGRRSRMDSMVTYSGRLVDIALSGRRS